MRALIENIIQQLEDVQNGKLWIGSSFDSKLNHIDENLVFLRPMESLHSVAEIISHLTLWRRETILKIQTGRGSKTDDYEENWLTASSRYLPFRAAWNNHKTPKTKRQLLTIHIKLWHS